MNTDQLKGKLEDAIGHVKQKAGELTGNEKLANEGVVDQAKGSARETWGNAKDAVGTTSDTTRDNATEQTGSTRQTISDKLHDAKDAINNRIDQYKTEHKS